MSVQYLVYNEICSTQLILEKFMKMAPEFTERLQSIWKEMGISANSQRDRVEAVMNYIQELLTDMVTDEENLLKELTKNTERYKQELSSLAQALGLPPYEEKGNLSLIEKEKDLRTKLDAWNLEKHERIKKLKRLREREEELCKRLALPAHDTSIREIPTAEQVKEIEANIKFMEDELAKAKVHFQQNRETILELWEELEINSNESEFPGIADHKAEDIFVLSKENLQQLKEHSYQLREKQEENRQLASELMKKLKSLWMKLEINEKDQSAFNENCVGFKPSSIEKLRAEVEKYEVMKLKYTEKFILGLRKELTKLWDKCFFGESERREFTPAFDNNYTEESLNLHEHQICVLQGFYEDNKAIFKLVEKREMMWRRLMEFENKENDPRRLFTNRGGALLKELKMKNAVKKGLPKVEEDLRRMIEAWQKENEGFFFVNGQKYLDVMTTQQENRKKEKDLLKLGKQKEKKEAIAKEMVYGSKPITPAKRANKNNSKYQNHDKRKRDDQFASSTVSISTTSSLLSSQLSSPDTISTSTAKTKKKTRNTRRLSSKIKKHQFSSKRAACIKVDDQLDKSKENDDIPEENCNESIQSLCSYPDFTSHIRVRRTERELESTSQSFHSLSPNDDASL